MLTVVRPERFVLLEHLINEGQYMGYAGPHQWNFTARDGRFAIWRPDVWVDAHAILERRAEIEIELNLETRWIRVALRKHPTRGASFSKARRFLRRIL
jgi:hypothetical protein